MKRGSQPKPTVEKKHTTTQKPTEFIGDKKHAEPF